RIVDKQIKAVALGTQPRAECPYRLDTCKIKHLETNVRARQVLANPANGLSTSERIAASDDDFGACPRQRQRIFVAEPARTGDNCGPSLLRRIIAGVPT